MVFFRSVDKDGKHTPFKIIYLSERKSDKREIDMERKRDYVPPFCSLPKCPQQPWPG